MSHFFIYENKNKKRLKEIRFYKIRNLIILNMLLGNLNKDGKKGFTFLKDILYYLKQNKKNKKNKPINIIKHKLSIIKPSILLYNKKRGTLFFELPRFLTREKSLQRSIKWLAKIPRKRKKNTLKNILLELKNISLIRGDILKKRKQIVEMAIKNIPFFYLLKKKKKKK